MHIHAQTPVELDRKAVRVSSGSDQRVAITISITTSITISITISTLGARMPEIAQISSKPNEKCKQKLVEDASTIEARMCNIEHDLICFEYFALKVKKLLISN